MKTPIKSIPDDIKLSFCLAVNIVCKHSGLKKKDLINDPNHKIAMHRFMVFALLEDLEVPYCNTGGLIGRDHSTVMHGVKEHKNLYDQNHKGYREFFDLIKEDFSKMIEENNTFFEDNHDIQFFESIKELNTIEESIKKIKSNLIDIYMEDFKFKDEIAEELKSALEQSA